MRDASKATYPTNNPPTYEDIKLGTMQRIADALELTAQNYRDLITERDRYRMWFQRERERTQRLERRIRSLRGVITRMKKSGAAGR